MARETEGSKVDLAASKAKTDASLAAEREAATRKAEAKSRSEAKPAVSEGTVSAKTETSKADKREGSVRGEAKKSDPENVVTDNILEGDNVEENLSEDSAPADPFKVPKELPATHLVEDDDPALKGKAGPKGIEVENVGPVLKSAEDFKDDAQEFPQREELDRDYDNDSQPRLASDREFLEEALAIKDVAYPGKNKGPKEAPMSRPLPEDTLAKKQMQENVHRGLAEDRDFEKRQAEDDLGEKITDDDEQPYQRPLAEDREAWKRRRGTLEKERGPEPV